MSKLYPIKVLLDANKKPFIPFITSTSIVVDGTEYTVQDMFDMRYTKEEVDAIIQSLGTLQRLRGRVDTYEDLLLIEGQQAGDTYIVGTSDTENSEYMWIGEKWEKLGPLVDLTDYYNKTDVDALLASAEANTAGAIAQGDNETLNLAKNYAEDKVAEAMSNISLDGALVYKGHVNSVEDLPSTGQPSGDPTSVNMVITSGMSPTYNSSRNYLDTFLNYLNNPYQYYFGGIFKANDSYYYVGAVTDYAECIDGFTVINRSGHQDFYVHITYDANKPVYIKTNAPVRPTLDSGGTLGGTVSTGSFVRVSYSAWYPLCRYFEEYNYNHQVYSNLNTIKFKAFTGTEVSFMNSTQYSGTTKYTSITNPNNYTYVQDYEILRFENGYAYWVTEDALCEENDVYTVGSNYEIYRCNSIPAWEHWSQGATSTGPIIVPLLLTSSSPLVTQSGTVTTFLNEKVAPVLKAVGPENVIVLINSTGMITEYNLGMFMYNADLTQLRKIDRAEHVKVTIDESGSYSNSKALVSYINIVYTDVDNYVVSSVSFSSVEDMYSKGSFLDPTETYSTPFIPTDPGHPVSKQYVDDLILGAEAALDEIIEGGIV